MEHDRWMLYGANGYSGERAARAAAARGLRPLLAGRNEAAIRDIAAELGLPHRVFPLDSPSQVAAQLGDVRAVVHAAGPFSRTAAPMRSACLASGTHYADITGEVAVFERARGCDREARAAGVVVCPGVGFDVIPTDCVAALLHETMPEATSLCLGFDGDMRPSGGTAKTALEGVAAGILVRRNGELTQVPRDFELRRIDFGRGPRQAAVIPWGDLSTAYHTTSIPDISVYVPERQNRFLLKLFPLQQRLLSVGPVRDFLERRVVAAASGPTANPDRPPGDMFVWGEVVNDAGDRSEARLTTANGYDVTVEGMLMTAAKLVDYDGRGGYFTPSQLFGKRIIEAFPGSSPIELRMSRRQSPPGA